MILGIMGPGRSGKDEAADFIIKNTNLKFRGTTSVIISQEVAKRRGITFDEAHALRHEQRVYWRALGDEMRKDDCTALAKEVLKGSNLLVGVRASVEIQKVREENLCDLIIWIDRPGIPIDPTQEFGSEMCDIVIQNHWTLEEYHKRLYNLVKTLDLLK